MDKKTAKTDLNRPVFPAIYKTITTLYLLMFSSVIIVELVNKADFITKRYRLLPNFACLLLGLAGIATFCLIAELCGRGVRKIFDIRFATVLLLATDLILLRNIYFRTGWDVEVIVDTARAIAYRMGLSEWIHNYYSWYPNNLLMTTVLTFFFRLEALGLWGDAVFAFAVFQCVLAALAGWLMFDVLNRCGLQRSIAITAWFVFALLIGLSPWLVIPYTDALGLVFPIALLDLYIHTDNHKHLIVKWVAILLLGYWGYRLKPQLAIVLIAIVISEILSFRRECLLDWKRKRKHFLISTTALVCCIACTTAFFRATSSELRQVIDDELNVGVLHYVMMGLNPERHGVYSDEDVDLSLSVVEKEERTERQLFVIKQRMEEYGLPGFLRHLYYKTLINFDDGSFSWGVEGGFYPEETMYEDTNSGLSPFLKSIFYTTGSRHIYLRTFWQALWLPVLLLCLAAVFRRHDRASTVSALSLIGLTLFETVFEARTRFFFSYAPLFITQAALGMHVIRDEIKKRNEVQKCENCIDSKILSGRQSTCSKP